MGRARSDHHSSKLDSSNTSRRDLLRGFGLLGAASLIPHAGPLASAQDLGEKPFRIDTHFHFSSPAFIAAIAARKTGQTGLMQWTPKKAIDEMDRRGTATAIVSTSEPGVWFGDETAARKLARECNEYGAQLMANYPGRFGMFATLPMPDVDGTLKEIPYALDTLKADGVCFMTSYKEKYLGDPMFIPIMEELNRRKTVVYTHPFRSECCGGLLPADLGMGFGIELTTDTTRTIASVLFSGITDRFPDIKFIWSHGGGTMPYITGRFEGVNHKFPKGLMYELRKFYYDTAQAFSPSTLAALTKLVPVSQIVFGTDYPAGASDSVVKGLRDYGFSPSELRAIERDNALSLFPKYRDYPKSK